jgi:outer membrane protein assembly factor BamD
MKSFLFLVILISIFLNSCSKKNNEIAIIKETSQELEMISVYKEAYMALNRGDPYIASKKFLEAEILYPQSIWAPKSSLMASYSYYLQNYYSEAIFNLERFIKTYPENENIVYAHYLIAMCYYQSIEDEKRDTAPIIKANEKFNLILEKFPETEFAIDARFKLNLIQDILASKEMYLGRHYMKKKKWIAAINRFKFVVDNYDQTIFIEEALHRLVEINFSLGLQEESKKYAKLLGYNYLSSEWYKKSYKIFNTKYDIKLNDTIKKDKKNVIRKFQNLFE